MTNAPASITIRTAIQDDSAALQHLYGYLLPLSITPDFVARAIRETRLRVAENASGAVVGFSVLSQRETMPPDQAFLWIAVDAAYRQQGIGAALMRDTIANRERILSIGYSEIISRVDEDSAGGLALCDQFGFTTTRRMLNMSLNLNTWDDAPMRAKLAQAEADGVQFASFADLGDTPDNRRKVYDLNKQLSANIPLDEPEDFPAFDAYEAHRFETTIFKNEGIHIAMIDGAWVGFSQISTNPDRAFAFVQMTGVLPAYQGRGIAQALKALANGFARECGYDELRTFNDTANAPMIAVNEKAGFVPAGGFRFVSHNLWA